MGRERWSPGAALRLGASAGAWLRRAALPAAAAYCEGKRRAGACMCAACPHIVGMHVLQLPAQGGDGGGCLLAERNREHLQSGPAHCSRWNAVGR